MDIDAPKRVCIVWLKTRNSNNQLKMNDDVLTKNLWILDMHLVGKLHHTLAEEYTYAEADDTNIFHYSLPWRAHLENWRQVLGQRIQEQHWSGKVQNKTPKCQLKSSHWSNMLHHFVSISTWKLAMSINLHHLYSRKLKKGHQARDMCSVDKFTHKRNPGQILVCLERSLVLHSVPGEKLSRALTRLAWCVHIFI